MRLGLTKRSDYAIRACVYLAEADRCPVSSRRIAAPMGIPPAFLPQVLGDLQRAGLVDSTSGKSGGYCLARDAARLSVLEVVEAIEGTLSLPGDGDVWIALDPTWTAARTAFTDVLATTSLADVARRWATGQPQTGGSIGPHRGPSGPERIPA